MFRYAVIFPIISLVTGALGCLGAWVVAQLTREGVSVVALDAAAGPVAQWSELAAHNRLVGGSSPPGPTTQSYANRDFPVHC